MFKLIFEIYSVLSSTISFPTSLCGVLVFDSVSRSRSRPRPLRSPLSHTIFHSHNFVTHHLFHPSVTHNSHKLCYTPSFTHTTLSHTICHTQLAQTLLHTIFHTTLSQLSNTIFHTPSFTHNFVTHNFVTHHLSLTQLCHTPSLRGTWRHPLSLWAGSGGALGRAGSPGAPRHFAWQVWRLVALTFSLRGKRGTWWHPPAFCLAGLALGGIHLRFALQTRHLVTSTFVSRGRRGTWGTGLALVARLGALETFAWEPVRGNFAWEPLGNLACLFLGTLLGNLASSWEPCVGILLGNLAWNLFLGTLLGSCCWESLLGNLFLGTLPGNLFLGTLLGNLFLGTLLGNLLGTLLGAFLPSWEPAWEPWAVRIWAAPTCSGTFSLWLKTPSLQLTLLGKNISPSRRNTIYT